MKDSALPVILGIIILSLWLVTRDAHGYWWEPLPDVEITEIDCE